MKILITGICGFAGSTLARGLKESIEGLELCGVDNFMRPGSELNREPLARLGVNVVRGDIRNETDMDAMPDAEWVIDAAANPSVLAGVNGTSSRDLLDHNLWGTVNVLEYCKARGAGLILLSTSRVYAIKPLAALPVEVVAGAYAPKAGEALPPGVSAAGVDETYSTAAPVSLYGASKLASEAIALEYGETFGLPVWINRCGVLAGEGQFGKADQGIFSFWINAHLRRAPLKYIGFDGLGHQVRDCLHPLDLLPLLKKQMAAGMGAGQPRVANIAGGAQSARSLRQLTEWCDARFGKHPVASDPNPRQFDLPWVVLDSSLAAKTWGWQPQTAPETIFEKIAIHAMEHPDWLQISSPV
jgi:CDP-paratose 2-epimerase